MKGKELADNPRQAAVDAEMAKFDAQHAAEKGKLPTIDLDAHGERYDGQSASGVRGGVTMTQYRQALQDKIAARRQYIRNNPTIQKALGEELKTKVQRIKTNQKKWIAGIFTVAACAGGTRPGVAETLMPTYEFIAKDGEKIEEVHSIKRCPDRIKRQGKWFKRVAFSYNPSVLADAQISTAVHGYPRTDFSLPKGDLGGGTDKDGRPIIKSQHHEQEIIRSSEGRMRRD